jgi:hypothetical protein
LRTLSWLASARLRFFLTVGSSGEMGEIGGVVGGRVWAEPEAKGELERGSIRTSSNGPERGRNIWVLHRILIGVVGLIGMGIMLHELIGVGCHG